MSWTLFFFALIGVTVLQGGFVNQLDLRLGGIQPVDLFLVLMLIYALRAPTAEARLAAFCVGLLQDLAGHGPVGAAAVSYGLAAALLVLLRENLRINLWVARFVLAGLAALVAQTLISTYVLLWLQAGATGVPLVLTILTTSLVAAILAASVPTESQHRGAHRPDYRPR